MTADDDSLAGPRQLKEKGSPAWCMQTVSYLKDCMRHVSDDWRQADQVLQELIEHRAWEIIPPGIPYRTLNRMLREEIGLDERAIKAQIRKADLAAHGGNQDPKTGKWNRSDNVTSVESERGNSESYTIRRLRRDRPDLADQVEKRELSASAAAIQAGFRHKTITVRLDDPASAARALKGHMSEGNLARLRDLL